MTTFGATATCRNLACAVVTYAYDTYDAPECPACSLRRQVDRVRDLADDLKPTRGVPCDDPEPCCGSAESCDAIYPSVRVVGREAILKALEADGGRAA